MIKKIVLAYTLFIILIFVSCRRTESSRAEFVMGTFCSVMFFEQVDSRVYQDIFNRIREIEYLMSANISGTDIDRVNAAAGIEPVQVHEDVFKVVEKALYFAEISGGAFDPSVGPLVSLWGIGTENPRVPTQEEIDEALQLVNWRDVELDSVTRNIFLKRRGMSLDLGAIAKGYAADEAAAIVKSAGLERAIIDFSGNIVTVGERKNKTPWRVGIQNPNEKRDVSLGILQVTEQTVVTSGMYERFFEEDGRRFHHIFSTSSGYPVENDLLSVSIISDNSMNADALSTTAFALGYEKGRELVESMPGTEAVFIFKDASVRKTAGADFTLTDSAFRIEG
jgi:thiamine biosynthesis lipoprotein